jgi:hypothetical protein
MKLIALSLLLASALAHADPEPLRTPPISTDCWPKQAGGVGTNYTVTVIKDKGSVYTWWGCPRGSPSRLIVSHETAVPSSTDPKVLLPLLQRMYVQHGYARDAGNFLVIEAATQLVETQPKR